MRPAKPESPPRRYVVLDSYRFIAALGIVIYHFEPHFGVFRPHQTEVLDRVQSLVDFFFVLSGFVLMHTYGTRVDDLGSYADFLRKRLARRTRARLPRCAAVRALRALGLDGRPASGVHDAAVAAR